MERVGEFHEHGRVDMRKNFRALNRRRFLELTALATLGATTACRSLPSSAPKVGKKGLCIITKAPQWREKIEKVEARWFYSWSSRVPDELPKRVEYVPMIFGKMPGESVVRTADLARQNRLDQLLGFNEPDQTGQANMTVDEALDLWPTLMKTGMRLGSPGCVHPDRDWMKGFMEGVDKRKLRVDFICVHSYGGLDVGGFINRMERVYRMFERPIWITEFAVGDWRAASRAENRHQPREIARFMSELLPRLDALKFIERYAWYPAKPVHRALGPCALFNDDGSLTEVGEVYRSI